MTESPLATAQRLFAQAVEVLRGVAAAGSADERVSVLTLCEGMARQLDQVTVATVAGLDRDGVLAERGYKSPTQALSDLIGWERFEAGLRRAVAARDRGCAHPGCGRPMSWTEVHHIREWECGGETKLDNLVALCRVHHRQIHSTEWIVRIRDGLPEFIPPKWIDFEQKPRRRELPHLAAAR